MATIYKRGQGYWTRLMSAAAAAILVGMGAIWLWDIVKGIRIGDTPPIYISASAAVIWMGAFGLLGYYLIGVNRRVVDFMIATEGEMKKVNWSTRREIMGMTWVVIMLAIYIALWTQAFDLLFITIFRFLRVLEA
ncbi:MAG: preprotein translocase subunit SecE [Phycisphaerales bacterium]|nr:preprotein translocase subunit SecE [Phycisphaerales bacterium]